MRAYGQIIHRRVLNSRNIEIPPYDLTDGYGIAGLYTIKLVKGK